MDQLGGHNRLCPRIEGIVGVSDSSDDVHVRLRYPEGGAVLDYRASRAIADRMARELGRHGVHVTIDEHVHDRLARFPHIELWG